MNALTKISEVLSIKDEALTVALELLTKEMEPCTENTCDPNSPGSYHWRGCPSHREPILHMIREAIKAR